MGKPKTVAYLRVSTVAQDNEKFKAAILEYANRQDFGRVKFEEEKISGKKSWKERKVFQIIQDLGEGDRLLTPELSRLGRSTLEVLEILKTAKEKGINIYSVKENLCLNGDGTSAKILSTMLALIAELERDFIAARTKEGLAAARAKGVRLGRPRGPGKSKLDEHKTEIMSLLKNGSTKVFVAKRYQTSVPNFHNWLRKNKIKVRRNHGMGEERASR